SGPRVDVIVPTLNGWSYLETCLAALCRQTFRDFRVIVVDDGSTDGTAQLVQQQFPEVVVYRFARNRGLAAAINAGIRAGQSELVAFLNNDTEPESDWLGELVSCLERHPEAAAAAGKLLLFDRRDTIHSAGDTFGVNGLPANRGVWQIDKGQYDREEPVFGACGGSALFRRAALDDVAIEGEVLDTSLFMYCEDVDLSWRLRLRGYEIQYAPKARVYHRLSATGGGALASFYVARNTPAVVVKNMPSALLRRYGRRIAGAQLRIAIETLPHWREPAARARLRGLFAFPLLLPGVLWDRRTIQRSKRVTDETIDQLLTR
ncbi:MAG TPA: glycosyltransferase family 2 protein, partial [Thermomicrobiaceae bacterium]|nr:glycosyltransferase family 2 protein [Thermomicrobiaceae bacterium]